MYAFTKTKVYMLRRNLKLVLICMQVDCAFFLTMQYGDFREPGNLKEKLTGYVHDIN